MASQSAETKALTGLIASTLALLAQFSATLNPNAPQRSPSPSEGNAQQQQAAVLTTQDPLRILSDASKLLKAHTTKLGLLAINKPFTPSAVSKVIREMMTTTAGGINNSKGSACIPAMMSAVQLSIQNKSHLGGDFLAREIQVRVRRVVTEVQCLLREVEGIATTGTSSSQRAGGSSSSGGGVFARAGGSGRDSLSSTGVVWESCDAVMELHNLGVGGLAVKKAEQYRDTLRDAIEELREWREGEDLECEGIGDGLLDSDDEGVDGERDNIDDIFHAANSMPKDRPELEGLVDEAQDLLKKVTILYNALLKRRLATFPRGALVGPAGGESDGGQDAAASPVKRLDDLMFHLRRIPHQVDELATCFYNLDEEASRDVLRKCVREALSATDEATRSWDGQEDKYSDWFRKWREAVTQHTTGGGAHT